MRKLNYYIMMHIYKYFKNKNHYISYFIKTKTASMRVI